MTPEKEKYYEKATRKLLATIDTMEMEKFERMRAKNLVLLFRDSFKLPNVKYKTFAQDLENNIGFLKYGSDGFCRVASLNFALMMGGYKKWDVMYVGDYWTYGPHHYLMHKPTKTILDLTFDQYTNYGLEIPYNIGHKIPYQIVDNNDPVFRFADAVGLDAIAKYKKQND